MTSSEQQESRRDEPELVAAIAAGDGAALGELYDRYGGMLLALAGRILGDSGDAEEIVQEAMLQAWRQADRYKSKRSSVSTWLVLITRSRAIDRLRNRKVVDRTAVAAHREKGDLHTSSEGPSSVLLQERRNRLGRELTKLPAEQRQVLEMAFFQGLTQREIAAAADIPLGTVKTRSLLAMKKLRAALEDEIEELL